MEEWRARRSSRVQDSRFLKLVSDYFNVLTKSATAFTSSALSPESGFL
jgi:hypothetical protein